MDLFSEIRAYFQKPREQRARLEALTACKRLAIQAGELACKHNANVDFDGFAGSEDRFLYNHEQNLELFDPDTLPDGLLAAVSAFDDDVVRQSALHNLKIQCMISYGQFEFNVEHEDMDTARGAEPKMLERAHPLEECSFEPDWTQLNAELSKSMFERKALRHRNTL